MPYVERRDGKIVGRYANPQSGYAEEWVSDDSAELIPTPIIPNEATPFQVRRALRIVGLRDQVEAYVASLPEEGRDAWEYAITIRRNNPILLAGAKALSLPDTKLDELFVLAASIT